MANHNFKIIERPGSRSRKPDALSRRPEYRPEGGARHREQSILKPEHFELSVCHRKDRIQIGLVRKKTPASNRLRIKRRTKDAKIPTKGSRLAAGHDIYVLEDSIIPPKDRCW